MSLTGLVHETDVAGLGVDDLHILAELWGGVVAGFFAGPISGKMERDLAVMKQWEGDVDPVIRSQIRKYIEGMEKNLRAQRIREEEG